MSTPLRQKSSYSRNAYLKKMATTKSKSPSSSSSSVSIRSRSPKPDPNNVIVTAPKKPTPRRVESHVGYIQLPNPFSGKVTRLGIPAQSTNTKRYTTMEENNEENGTGHGKHDVKFGGFRRGPEEILEGQIEVASPSFRNEFSEDDMTMMARGLEGEDRQQTGPSAEQSKLKELTEDTTGLAEVIKDMKSRKADCSVEKVMDITSVLARQLNAMKLTMTNMQRSISEKEEPGPGARRLMRTATETDGKELINGSYKRKFEEANGELLRLKEELSSLRQGKEGEIAAGVRKILELEERLAKAKEENGKLDEELKKAEMGWREEKGRLTSDLGDKNSQIESLRKTELKCRTYEEKCIKLQSLNDKLAGERQTLQSQIQQLTSDLGTRTEEFRSMVASLQEQRSNRQTLKGSSKCPECEAAEERNVRLGKEITGLKVDLGKARLELENSLRLAEQVRKERDEMEKMVVKFREQASKKAAGEAAKTEQSVERNKELVAASEEALKKAEEELKEAQMANEVAKEENSLLKSSIQDLETELEGLKTKGSGKVELIKLRGMYSELEGKFKSLVEENKLLKTRGVEERNNVKSSQEWEEDYGELKAKYETALAMGKDWQEKLKELAVKQKERGDKEAYLTKENEKVTQQYTQLLKEFQDMGSKKQKEGDTELADYRAKLVQHEAAAELLKKQCEEKEARLASTSKEIEKLKAENEQLMTKLQTLCETQARLSKQVQDLIILKQELEAKLQGKKK